MAMQEKQLEKKDEELIVMVADMISASELMESFDSGMESKVSDLEERMETEKKKLQDLQVQKGTLIQKAEDVKSMKEEISELKKDIEACALITTRYDVLKPVSYTHLDVYKRQVNGRVYAPEIAKVIGEDRHVTVPYTDTVI